MNKNPGKSSLKKIKLDINETKESKQQNIKLFLTKDSKNFINDVKKIADSNSKKENEMIMK